MHADVKAYIAGFPPEVQERKAELSETEEAPLMFAWMLVPGCVSPTGLLLALGAQHGAAH